MEWQPFSILREDFESSDKSNEIDDKNYQNTNECPFAKAFIRQFPNNLTV